MYYSWKITLISLALSPLIAIVGSFGSINMKAAMKSASKAQQTEKFLGTLMSDSVCNIRTVKSMGQPQAFLNTFSVTLDEIYKEKQSHKSRPRSMRMISYSAN
jgi:ABC-type bacteriocin/lantibiotic exporter with double-glycine peptidase domain